MAIGPDTVRITFRHARSMTLRVAASFPHIRMGVPPDTPESTIREFYSRNIAALRNALGKMEKRAAIGHTGEEYAAFYRKTAALLETWRGRMQMPPVRLRMKSMTSRWGSCIPAKRIICINSRLIDYDDECLGYVIIHELAHLHHHGHGPDFWHLVGLHCPAWRQIRARMRD